MSKKSNAFHSISQINNLIGGSNATKKARGRHGREIVEYLISQDVHLRSIREIETGHVKKYATYLTDLSKNYRKPSAATIQNKLASIRSLLSACGKDLTAMGIATSKELEIESRSRIGTKLPITDELFDDACKKCLEFGEIGMLHAINLERYLGLRGLEALMSTNALLKLSKEANGISTGQICNVDIYDGTKGGRPRVTQVIFEHADVTMKVIKEALLYAQQNGGYLIEGKKSGLKTAKYLYHNLARKIDLVGEYAPHSLRYRYACDKLNELYLLGVPRKEAFAAASAWLGHGEARGRFVSMVYGKTVAHKFKITTKIKDQSAVLNFISKL